MAEILELKDLNAKLDEMKTAFELKAKNAADEAKAAFELQLKSVTDKMAEIKGLSADITVEDLLKIKSDLKTTIEDFDKFQIQVKQGKITKDNEQKSFSENLKEAIESKADDFGKMSSGEIKEVRIQLKAVGDFSTANVTGGNVWGANYRPGIITNPNTIGHIRNMLPVISPGEEKGTDFYFLKENGNGEGAPAPTAETTSNAAAVSPATGLKPAFDVDLVEASVKYEIIPGVMTLSNKALRNIPGLLSFLNMRVPEKLMDAEDNQFLYGNGTSPNLKGILTSGNYTASTNQGASLISRIINDIGTLSDTYKRRAASIWIRPAEYWGLFLNTASGSGEFNLPRNVNWVNGVLYIGDIPVMPTTAINAGTYVVAAQGGAEIIQQEGMTMRFFEQHANYAQTNQTLLRIEEVVALPVYGSTYFILGEVPVAE